MCLCHSNQIPDGGKTEAHPQEKPPNLGLDVCHHCSGRTVDVRSRWDGRTCKGKTLTHPWPPFPSAGQASM